MPLLRLKEAAHNLLTSTLSRMTSRKSSSPEPEDAAPDQPATSPQPHHLNMQPPAPGGSADPLDMHPYVFLQRERLESSLTYEDFTVDTRDHDDHTFCGVMFDLCCKKTLPVDYMEIQAIWVRGDLGPMTVWTTASSFRDKHDTPEMWTLIYKGEVASSPQELVKLELETPLRIDAGGSCGLYIHSATPGDSGLVYDNQKDDITHEDNMIEIRPGLAHLSNKPFGRRGLWSGNVWRRRREFVGRLSYGARYMRWNPDVHLRFPAPFQKAAEHILLCSRRPDSPLYSVEEELVFYIINKLGWDWFGKAPSTAQQTLEYESIEVLSKQKYGQWHQYDDNFTFGWHF